MNILLIIAIPSILFVSYEIIKVVFRIKTRESSEENLYQTLGIQARKSNLYTRTGDSGMTYLYNGERLPKASSIFDVLGSLDHLNSVLGVCCAHNPPKHVKKQLRIVQSYLIDIGSHIATPMREGKESQYESTRFEAKRHIPVLEGWIDYYDSVVPKLTNFILPGGSVLSSHLHVSRAVCRETERQLFKLNSQDCHDVCRYINRLSDYLFALSRYACMMDKEEEIVYKKN